MTIPDAPAKPSRFAAIALYQFFVTGTTGFIQPFLPLYIIAAGLTAQQYGYAAAIGTATCLLVQPLLGKLSDRFDTRVPLMMGAALIAGLAYSAFRLVPTGNFFLLTVLLALGANGFTYLNAAVGVIVARLAEATGEAGGSAYVRTRVWGSVGYIVIALTASLFVRGGNLSAKPPRSALDAIFLWGPLLFLVIAAVCRFVPDARTIPGTVAPLSTDDAPQPTPPDTAATANRRRFLLAFLLYQVSLYGASAYLSLYLAELRAAPIWLTATFAAGVVCEVLVMTQIGRWTDRHGRRPAMLFSFLLLPLRLLLYIPATSPLWVLLVQTLHGFNFGILGTIAVVFVSDTATDKTRGSAQAELAATLGLGNSIGPVLCGYLVETHGLPTMFAAMSGLATLSVLLFCAFVGESHDGAQGDFASRMPRFLREPWLRYY